MSSNLSRKIVQVSTSHFISMDPLLYSKYHSYLTNGILPSDFPSTRSNFLATSRKFTLDLNGDLMRNNRKVLKFPELETTFSALHEHSSRDKTYQKFHERYWFPGMSIYVREKVRECVGCANKNSRHWPAEMTPLVPIPVDPQVMWRIHADIMGPLKQSESGNKYVIIAVDAFTKYVEVKGNVLLKKK